MKIGDRVQIFPYEMPGAAAQGRVILHSSSERALIIAFRSPPAFMLEDEIPEKPSPIMVILYQPDSSNVWLELPRERQFVVELIQQQE